MAQECLFLLLVIFSLPILPSTADEKENPPQCPTSFTCQKLEKEIHFPFTNTTDPDCGFPIKGCDDSDPGGVTVQLGKEREIQYEIKDVYQIGEYNSFSVQLPDLQELLFLHNCRALDYIVPLLPVPSSMLSLWIDNIITLRVCSSNHTNAPRHFWCNGDDGRYSDPYYGLPEHDKSNSPFIEAGCSTIQLPIKLGPGPSPNHDDPFTFLTADIHVSVILSPECHKCYYESGGQCRSDPESPNKFFCDNARAVFSSKKKQKLMAMIIVASVAGVAILMVLAYCYGRKVSPRKNENLTHCTIEAFLKYQLYLSTKRYNYSEIKKMTNSFKDKLGKGGYGTVYKGKLSDGHLVAVKVLIESKGNGEEFINEVASISRTSHVNIVSLLGFCLQGSKRALVYEFMHNGSLEKFICEESVPVTNHILDCETLYNIAIGVARGLEYLHKGCNTRILHFDIKPHNILLDEHFCPKISDFGLAKICSRKESIVSMLGTRGTVGYIAPELFCRNFGGVSHKSDVYSYGMLVLEMFGGRKKMNVEGECSSEIYFPNWIYKRLELNEEMGLKCVKNERDEERVRKMTLVSLWCIQAIPSTRPTMSEVVEMLEGSLESLKVPPKPVLSSPPGSLQPIHSTQACDTFDF